MCNATRLFVLTVILAMTVAVSPAAAQIDEWAKPSSTPAPTATPAPTPAPTATPEKSESTQIVELKKQLESERAARIAAEEKIVTEDPKPWMPTWLRNTLFALVVVLVAVFIFRRFRRNRATEEDHDHDHDLGDTGHHGGTIATLALLMTLGFSGVASAQSPCWNVDTGKTIGASKVAIAIATKPAELSCNINGKVVEVVSLPTETKVVDGVVKTEKPLTFTMTVPSAGRMAIKVDGKVVSSLVVTPDGGSATLLNAAVDLASSTSTVDKTARANATKAITEIKNVNGRLTGIETKVSVIAEAHNELESRTAKLESRPTYDDSAIKAELAAARVAHNELVDKLDQLTATQTAMGKDVVAINSKADAALEQIGELKFTTLKFGTRGEKRALRHIK